MKRFYTEIFFYKNEQEFFNFIKTHKDEIFNFISLGFFLFFLKRHFFSHEKFFKKNLPYIFNKLKYIAIINFNNNLELEFSDIFLSKDIINIEDKIIFLLYENNYEEVSILSSEDKTFFSKNHIFNILLYFNFHEEVLDLIKNEKLSTEQVLLYLKSNKINKIIDHDDLLTCYPYNNIIEYLIKNFLLDDNTKEEIEVITNQIFEDVEDFYKNKKNSIAF
tara:strand:+ start:24390 stop:25049 length:660 start_codon:yes stop_codon:yes gene_type:complete